MNSEILGVVLMFVLTLAIAFPLGRYIGKVFNYEKTWLDTLFNPIDKLFFKLSGINESQQMNWKQHLAALLSINAAWFLLSMIVLTNMAWLPLNPDNNPSMSGDLAFNTAISFICNTNLQHYSGESGMSYLGQLVLMLWQFLSAGTGIAIAAVVFVAMKERTTDKLGNFYSYFVRSCTRILFPIAVVVATVLVFNGMPMTFEGKDTMTTLQGDTVQVSRGPVAAFTAIKHLGTNGGGFFGVNSAHPFEIPSYFTNIVEMITQMLIPFALIFALGYVINRKKLSWMIFGVMTIGFTLLVVPTIISEMNGNPAIARMGISQIPRLLPSHDPNRRDRPQQAARSEE